MARCIFETQSMKPNGLGDGGSQTDRDVPAVNEEGARDNRGDKDDAKPGTSVSLLELVTCHSPGDGQCNGDDLLRGARHGRNERLSGFSRQPHTS